MLFGTQLKKSKILFSYSYIWPFEHKFSKCEYSPDFLNSCEYLHSPKLFFETVICQTLANLVFGKFDEFSTSGKFGEGRLDPCIPKKIFYT
jgi:hypothetical protein